MFVLFLIVDDVDVAAARQSKIKDKHEKSKVEDFVASERERKTQISFEQTLSKTSLPNVLQRKDSSDVLG